MELRSLESTGYRIKTWMRTLYPKNYELYTNSYVYTLPISIPPSWSPTFYEAILPTFVGDRRGLHAVILCDSCTRHAG